eukprot:10009468-Ditylum_brightwellii.AAC.1
MELVEIAKSVKIHPTWDQYLLSIADRNNYFFKTRSFIVILACVLADLAKGWNGTAGAIVLDNHNCGEKHHQQQEIPLEAIISNFKIVQQVHNILNVKESSASLSLGRGSN